MRRLVTGAGLIGLLTTTAGVLPAVAVDTVSLQRIITNDWTNGFCADVRVTTLSTTPFTWNAPFDPQGSITSLWSAKTAGSPGNLTVSGLSWNSTVSASTPVTFGYCATRTAPPAPPPPPSPTQTPPPSPTQTPSPTPTQSQPVTDAGITLTLATRTEWGSGRTIDATVTTATAATSWSVAFPSGMTISNMWSAINQSSSGTVKAANATWNGKLAAKGSTTFGFTGTGPKEAVTSCSATVNGAPVACSLAVTSTPTPTPTTPTPTASTPTTPTPTVTSPPSPPAGDLKVVGYYPGWATYGRNFQVADIPAAKLTHVNYAFANISGGKCVVGDPYADTDKFFPGDSWDVGAVRGNYNQLNKLKAVNPHLKSLISVGGWTWSSQFSNAALTADSRKVFVDSCVAMMKKYGFDGLDIDWEYPVRGGLQNGRSADKQNFTLLLQDLNAALDLAGAADNRDYLLTIAAPAGPDKVNNIEPAKVAAAVDWINLMTYDYNGAWNSYTGHNAPLTKPTGDPGPAGLYDQATVDNYIAKGVPASKLVLGVPFYGRSWKGVQATNNGLFQAGTTGPGTWEAGMLDYKDIAANYLTNSGYVKYYDASAQVPYLYNAATGVFVTYDDAASVQAKAAWAVSKGLGGAMLWELSADTSDTVLLDAVRDGLG